MPCDQIRTTEVDLRAANQDILLAALRDDLKLRVNQYGSEISFYMDGYSCSITNGVLEISSAYDLDEKEKAALANKVNRAYSATVVQRQFASGDWKVNEITQAQPLAQRQNVRY